jgi:ubiquinone/menaquinone biosynthesis C-methylase UbiE
MPAFDHFGFIAPWYDKFMAQNDRAEMVERAKLPASGFLLDIGGGTGRVSASLVELVDGIQVVDLSIEMLKFAQHKQLPAVCASGEFLPYQNDSFSRVLIIDALHHFYRQAVVIQEVWRVLQPGGLLAIVEPNYDLFSGKAIALLEKLLLMKSRFLKDESIASLFSDLSANVRIYHHRSNSWFVIKKLI